jgi:hypothetical protein
MSTRTTFAPYARSDRAISRPIPCPAPGDDGDALSEQWISHVTIDSRARKILSNLY